MSESNEVSFPRGKLAEPASTAKRVRRKQARDDLFKVDRTKGEDGAKKRKPGAKKRKAATEDDLDERILIEELNVQRLPIGSLVMGCVEEVRDFEIRLSLPGGIQAEVPIGNISETYTELLEKFAEDPELNEAPLKPESLFRVGHSFPMKVLDKKEDDHTYKGAFVSKIHVIGTLNPKDVYEEVVPSFLKDFNAGLFLSAAVKSIEDHGYVMDVGIRETQGFLKREECSVDTLYLGQLVTVGVKSYSGRILQLTMHKNPKTKISGDESAAIFPPPLLLPGLNVSATVMNVTDDGLEIMVMNEFKGYVHKNHLSSVWDMPSKTHKISQTVTGTILFRNPNTKLIALCLRPIPDPPSVRKMWSILRPGLIVSKALVVGKDNAGTVVLKVANGAKAVAPLNELSDDFVSNNDLAELENRFAIGSKHECRIKSIAYMDGFAKVTLKPSLLQKEDIPLEDIQIGTIIKGKVIKLNTEGLVIDLGYKLQGFVPNRHLVEAPVVSNPEKLFPLDKVVRCRVIRLDKERTPPKITMTLKKSLLSKSLNIIDFYNKAEIGEETDGVVVLVNEHGILVELFNYVRGWVPRNFLSETLIKNPEQVFQVGQIVHCTIVTTQPTRRKMTLSLMPLQKTEEVREKLSRYRGKKARPEDDGCPTDSGIEDNGEDNQMDSANEIPTESARETEKSVGAKKKTKKRKLSESLQTEKNDTSNQEHKEVTKKKGKKAKNAVSVEEPSMDTEIEEPKSTKKKSKSKQIVITNEVAEDPMAVDEKKSKTKKQKKLRETVESENAAEASFEAEECDRIDSMLKLLRMQSETSTSKKGKDKGGEEAVVEGGKRKGKSIEKESAQSKRQKKTKKLEKSKREQLKKSAAAELERLPVEEGFNWNTEDCTPDLTSVDVILKSTRSRMSEELQRDEDDSSESASSSDEEEKKGSKVKERKTRKMRNEEAREREEYLRKRENTLLDKEKQPETVNDFERLVISSPNSSMNWIHYMSFHLEQGEVDSARSVAERALTTISFREEQEKFNVWVALLNLENIYGTPESLDDVFRRALEKNDQLKVYTHLIKIYVDTDKTEAAEQLYKVMIKKFKKEKSVWINYGLFYMKTNQVESARSLMERSFLSLEKREHVDVICKFAQMEFQFGDVERGKTMFETLLDQYTKRVDLWSIYVDMLIKHSSTDTAETIGAIRNVFERAITLKLPPKKMQTMFKKYLDFESKYGNKDTIARVKQKARDYVEGNPLLS